jgi:hypothetical protein
MRPLHDSLEILAGPISAGATKHELCEQARNDCSLSTESTEGCASQRSSHEKV